jgi:hypothetical protein
MRTKSESLPTMWAAGARLSNPASATTGHYRAVGAFSLFAGDGIAADRRSRPMPTPSDPTTGLDQVLDALAQRFGGRFSVNETVRQQHAHTLTWTANEQPDAVY